MKDNEASHAGKKAAEVLGGGFSTAFSFTIRMLYITKLFLVPA
jgi:hypothetical protein